MLFRSVVALEFERILAIGDANGTRFEFECYDTSHLYNLAHFRDRGLVRGPLFVQSVFGLLGGIGTHPDDVAHMRRTADRLLGDGYEWSVLGAGKAQMSLVTMGATMGAHVRVGLEDSLWIGPGRQATSNAEQVTRVRGVLGALSIDVATPAEARALLCLKGGASVGF